MNYLYKIVLATNNKSLTVPIFTIVFTSLLVFSCESSDINSPQNCDKGYEEIFDSTYDTSFLGLSGSSSIIELSHGGYLVAGRFYNYSNTAVLVRIDENGNQVWYKTYNNAFLHSVIETKDNSFVTIGKNDNGIYILKIDYEGNILWEINHNFSYDASSPKVIENKNGNYLIIANSTEANSKAILINISTSGTINWTKLIAGNGVVKVYSIIENQDSTLNLIGASNVYSTNESFLLTLDKNGDELQRKSINMDLSELSYSSYESSVHQNSLGYYAGCGLDVFILIDPLGSPIIKNKIPESYKYDGVAAYSLCPHVNNGFIVCGVNTKVVRDDSTQFSYTTYAALFLFDKNGNYLKSLDVRHNCGFSEATSIILTKDNSIVFTGSATSCKNNQSSIWIKKIKIK